MKNPWTIEEIETDETVKTNGTDPALFDTKAEAVAYADRAGLSSRTHRIVKIEQAATTTKREPTSIETHPCLCGCGTQVTRRFAQGHDARLHGVLVRAFRAGERVEIGGKSSSTKAGLKAMEWPIPAPPAERKPRASKGDQPKAHETQAVAKAKAIARERSERQAAAKPDRKPRTKGAASAWPSLRRSTRPLPPGRGPRCVRHLARPGAL